MSNRYRVENLPRWAQDRITQLEREVARLQAERNAGPDETDTFVDHMGDRLAGPAVEYQPLRRGAVVTYWPHAGYPEPRQGRITSQWVDDPGPGMPQGYLEVCGSGLSAAIVVMPWATNVVRIVEVPLR